MLFTVQALIEVLSVTSGRMANGSRLCPKVSMRFTPLKGQKCVSLSIVSRGLTMECDIRDTRHGYYSIILSETCSLSRTLKLPTWMYDLCGQLYLYRVN